MLRTSQSHPLSVDVVVAGPARGRVAMTSCPGQLRPLPLTGARGRDLDAGLGAVVATGATTLVSVMEPPELAELGVPRLSERAREAGLAWWGLAIPDGGIPTGAIERRYRMEVEPDLLRRLRGGEMIV